MLVGGAGAAVAAVGGWFVFLRDSGGGPEGVVRSYVSALDSGNTEEAESLVHEDSPSSKELDGSGNLGENLDYSVESIETSDAGPGYNESSYETVQEFETLEVTTRVSGTVFGQERDETSTDTVVLAKNADDEWKIWD
ncbi:MAG: hypothetical protein J07HX64_02843 [halophilic archaeon J07HX64]|nr:MAG: hypothetical protein J07HX64_02843 [halophilic archaeon J07HX64]